jgi:ribosomal protein L11 methyltransferase
VKWIEIRVDIDAENAAAAVDRIAAVFHEMGSKGVVIEDPALEPDEGWGGAPVARPDRPAVTGYFPAIVGMQAIGDRLQVCLEQTAADVLTGFRLSRRTIDEVDWSESWKSFFKPLRIAPDILIKPSWETAACSPLDVVIEIDPGMAFGTGAHPTTALCLRLLRERIVPGDRVIDVGTGSGILAIAAVKLGAGYVVAVDSDRAALAVAAENLERNQISADRCRLVAGHLVDALAGSFDLVVANILTEPVIALLKEMPRLLRKNGSVVVSGIIAGHRVRMQSAMEAMGLALTDLQTEEGWIALAGRLQA